MIKVRYKYQLHELFIHWKILKKKNYLHHCHLVIQKNFKKKKIFFFKLWKIVYQQRNILYKMLYMAKIKKLLKIYPIVLSIG